LLSHDYTPTAHCITTTPSKSAQTPLDTHLSTFYRSSFHTFTVVLVNVAEGLKTPSRGATFFSQSPIRALPRDPVSPYIQFVARATNTKVWGPTRSRKTIPNRIRGQYHRRSCRVVGQAVEHYGSRLCGTQHVDWNGIRSFARATLVAKGRIGEPTAYSSFRQKKAKNDDNVIG